MYSAIFTMLAEQEAAARGRGGRGGADEAPAPGFGASGAAWDDVLAFYAHWQGFSTAKGFAWADQYNPGSAPNRKARRRWRAGQGCYCLAWKRTDQQDAARLVRVTSRLGAVCGCVLVV